jgi:hypothetical protein
MDPGTTLPPAMDFSKPKRVPRSTTLPGPPLAESSRPAPTTRMTRSSTPTVNNPLPTVPAGRPAQRSRVTSTMEPIVEDLEANSQSARTQGTTILPGHSSKLSKAGNSRKTKIIQSSDDDNEAQTMVPQPDRGHALEHSRAQVFLPTPLPSFDRHVPLIVDAQEQAFLDAEARENEEDPDADLEEDGDEELVGFGQPRSPSLRRSSPSVLEEDDDEPFVGFGQPRSPFPRRSGPPNTDTSSDEGLDMSHQQTRDAKGKGRAQPDEDDDDEDDELEPDEGPNGENPLH